MPELNIGELAGTGAAILAVCATLVQISPIKINPWSALAKAVGRAVNGEVIDKVNKLESRIEEIARKDEEREAKGARLRILRFGDECQHGEKHSQEHFAQILDDIDEYEEYCCEHPDYKNNKAVLTIERIKLTYKHCLEHDDFL